MYKKVKLINKKPFNFWWISSSNKYLNTIILSLNKIVCDIHLRIYPTTSLSISNDQIGVSVGLITYVQQMWAFRFDERSTFEEQKI